MLSGFCPACFALLFCSQVLGCRYTPQTAWPSSPWWPVFTWVMCFSVIFLIIDPWQSCVCFIRSGVTRCTLLMVLYLDYMCRRVLHAVLWSHISTLMHCLAAEPCSTTGLLFPFRCPSGMILLAPFSMVWDWQVSRAGPMLLYWPKLLHPYYSLLLSFSSFCLQVGIVELWSLDW